MARTEARHVFVTVVDCGNVRAAAGQLFRTQSALSMTLKQVEDIRARRCLNRTANAA